MTLVSKNLFFFFKNSFLTTVQDGRRRLVRQDTPMPRHETTPTHGFEQANYPSSPQVILNNNEEENSREMLTSSPMNNNQIPPTLSSSPDSSEDILSQLDNAIDTLNNNKPAVPIHRNIRPQSTESMLFCNDFGMNELMVMIRGAAAATSQNKNSIQIRSEISDVFKDSQTRLDQLEKVHCFFIYLFIKINKKTHCLLFT